MTWFTMGMRTAQSPTQADGVFVALYRAPHRSFGSPVTCAISSWKRTAFAVPAQMKIGGHYFMLGLVRRQAAQLGSDDAILLNERDHVCETTGAAILLFLDGTLATPPESDGALPSITAKLILHLAQELGIRISSSLRASV